MVEKWKLKGGLIATIDPYRPNELTRSGVIDLGSGVTVRMIWTRNGMSWSRTEWDKLEEIKDATATK